MSIKAANRPPILEKLKRRELTQIEAARELELSVRQVRRIMQHYRLRGTAALVHGNRGRPSNRAIASLERQRALQLIKDNYRDFGPTLAHEKLTEQHGVTFSLTSLRTVLIEAGLWQVKKHRLARIHPLRKRLPMNGQLIQADGSPFDWFEGRTNPTTGQPVGICSLIVAIDDATSELKALHFEKEETTTAYFRALTPYFEREGKPLAFYVDHDGIFTVNEAAAVNLDRKRPQIGELSPMTQFARAMKDLHVKLILAPGPEAKGRVERVNQTLQDRLTKELRLRNISNMETANRYLPKFREWFNRKFAVIPESPVNAHRSLLPSDNLQLILAHQTQRTLSRNLTCQYDHVIYQVIEKRPRYALRRAIVTIIQDTRGRVRLTYQGKLLDYKAIAKTQARSQLTVKQLDLLAKETTTKTYWERLTETQWGTYAVA